MARADPLEIIERRKRLRDRVRRFDRTWFERDDDGVRVERLRNGPRSATGVPGTIAEGERPLGLALKSGNFGAPDFFARALEMTA
ncbi:MAG: hypothetical protein NVSMB64_30550 [Candidatus Velthaea sp.]